MHSLFSLLVCSLKQTWKKLLPFVETNEWKVLITTLNAEDCKPIVIDVCLHTVYGDDSIDVNNVDGKHWAPNLWLKARPIFPILYKVGAQWSSKIIKLMLMEFYYYCSIIILLYILLFYYYCKIIDVLNRMTS